MLTVGFGEILTDILTVNPAIKSIPSASSILDVSNYTFNAVTLGKDSEGFLQHGHSLFTTEAFDLNLSIFLAGLLLAGTAPPGTAAANLAEWSKFGKFNDGFITALRYNNTSPSSYHTSATYLQLSSSYNSIPNYPSIYDNRLERKTTRSSAEFLLSIIYKDIGHYVNPVIDSRNLSSIVPELEIYSPYMNGANLSSLWNVIGYPPSGNTGKFRLVSSITNVTSPIVSGSLSGVFNSQGVIDRDGFININSIPQINSFSSGPFVSAVSSTFSSTPTVDLNVRIAKGDAASLALLGGVYHIGVWALDIKQMLKSGLNPPYSWNNINNSRKYKLIAKITFWDNILNHNDNGSNSGLVILNENTGSVFTHEGPTIKLQFNFK